MGEHIWAMEFPKPMMKRPAMYTGWLAFVRWNIGCRRSCRLTPVSVAECTNQGTQDHKTAANHDGDLAADVVGHVGNNEERDNRADVVHVDENAQLAGVVGLWEVGVPCVHLLGGVDHLAIVACGGRCNKEKDRHEVQLAQVRLAVPDDLLKLRRASVCIFSAFNGNRLLVVVIVATSLEALDGGLQTHGEKLC